MSLRLKLPLHGRSHRHAGSDPIGTFIEYDVLNVGGWLNIEATNNLGIKLKWPDTGTFYTHDASQQNYVAITGGTGGDLQLAAGTGGFNFQTTGQAAMGASQWDFSSTSAGINFIAAQSFTARAQGTGTIDFRIASGQVCHIRDAAGNPIFEARDDGTIHILTGATIVADL